MIDQNAIRERFLALSPHLDERGRRMFAAAEAKAAGYGGIAAVFRATGIAPSTIGRGLRQLAFGSGVSLDQVRRPGGGRKALTEHDPGLVEALLALVEPTERGDPETPLRWTCKSLRRLAAELRAQGHSISHTVVGELLRDLNFSLQGNRKTKEGEDHADRDAQFRYLNKVTKAALAQHQPVISVDTTAHETISL
jgi:DDE family transposase